MANTVTRVEIDFSPEATALIERLLGATSFDPATLEDPRGAEPEELRTGEANDAERAAMIAYGNKYGNAKLGELVQQFGESVSTMDGENRAAFFAKLEKLNAEGGDHEQ